jgi:hypothetical protein
MRAARQGAKRGGRRVGTLLLAAVLLAGAGAKPAAGQVPPESAQLAAVKVFLDGRNLQWDYIRSEIPYLNYVRDRRDADVHILITTQPTGSGGSDYSMAFIGLNDFEDINFTLHYFTDRTDVGHDVRRGIVRTLQKGLLPFVARTPMADKFDVVYDPRTPVRTAEVRDRWDYWVFSLSASGATSGVKTRTSGSFSGNLSANRVTRDWKIRMGANMAVDSAKYYLEDGNVESTNERESFSGLIIRSLTDHWSAGFWLSFSAASYNNIKLSYSPSVAAEYSFFPYVESTRRQLYFQYRLSYNHYAYMETTIYDKIREDRFRQSLALILELTQPWGTAYASISGSHFLDDIKVNRLALSGSLSFRLFRGLSFWVSGSYSAIHDQISLPLAGASLDEILLLRKDQATTYSYGFNLGFSFTFGSKYSNVVNPRFE